MSTPHNLTMPEFLRTLGTYALAWLTSWQISEVQAVAGTFSFLCVGGFAGLQAYVLWRDKVRKPPAE